MSTDTKTLLRSGPCLCGDPACKHCFSDFPEEIDAGGWDLWADIGTVTAWLDANNGDRTPEMTLALRIIKLGEEVGEVSAALIGVHGQNPRKGHTHTADDLAGELCDVIVTAAVALTTLTGDPVVAKAHLAAKVGTLLKRVEATGRIAWTEGPLIDPDCRDGKCGSCFGGPCEHGCHKNGANQ